MTDRRALLRTSPGGLVPGARPAVVAHRGASAVRPEHTLAGYELAARMGADYLEPDLVSTRDHVLVARHGNRLDDTTDVAARPELAGYRRTRTVLDPHGRPERVTGWFVEDLTLAQLRTLRARTRLPERTESVAHDGRLGVPTFEEVLDLRERLVRELGRPLGVYPETKTPEHFARAGLALEEPLLRAVRARGLDVAGSPVLVQSFDQASLHRLRELGSRLPHVQLLDGRPAGDGSRLAPSTWAQVGNARAHGVVDAVGAHKALLLDWDGDADPAVAADPQPRDLGLVAAAHDLGLAVHVWTLAPEDHLLPAALRGRGDRLGLLAEARAHLELGVDAIFTDATDTVVLARAQQRERVPA